MVLLSCQETTALVNRRPVTVAQARVAVILMVEVAAHLGAHPEAQAVVEMEAAQEVAMDRVVAAEVTAQVVGVAARVAVPVVMVATGRLVAIRVEDLHLEMVAMELLPMERVTGTMQTQMATATVQVMEEMATEVSLCNE